MEVNTGRGCQEIFDCYQDDEGFTVAESILDAIKDGQWDYEPEHIGSDRFSSTSALPGTDEKLDILSVRVRAGLPLWHPEDRRTYDDSEEI